MWNVIFETVKAALAAAFASRNDEKKYRVKVKEILPNGKFDTKSGTLQSVSIEAVGGKWEVECEGQNLVLEAQPGTRYAKVLVDGTEQEKARIVNRIHFSSPFKGLRTLVDYHFRPIEWNGKRYRIEIDYR